MVCIYKCIVIVLLLGSTIISAYAQLPEKGDWTTRVGIKNPAMVPDLHQKVFNHPPFYTPRKELTYSDYMEYYESFKKLADSAPYINWNFYGGKFSDEVRTDLGNRTIYESILDSIPDMAIRMVLVEDFLALARNMVDNLDSINVARNNRDTTVKAADDTLSLPVAMTKYAHLYYKYAGNPKYYPAHLYSKVQARDNFRKAFRMLVEKNIDPGQELEAFYVREYYLACEDLYNSDRDRYYEQFLNDYLEIIAVCDNLLLPYVDGIKMKDQKYDAYLYATNGMDSNVPYGIRFLFPLTEADIPEYISRYYLDKLPAHENDHEYMEKALYVMRELKADRSQAYYKYSKTSYAIRPTYLNCLGCAFLSWEEGNLEAMDAYCSLADSLAPDSLSKGLVYYYTAMEIPARRVGMLRKEGKVVPKDSLEYQKWDYEMTLASQYLNKMMDLSATFAKSPKIEQRGFPRLAANHFYNIQRNIGRTKRETSYIDEAKKYRQLYATHEELIKIEQELLIDISGIKKEIKGISTSVRTPMSPAEHTYLNNLYRAVNEIFFDLEGYDNVSFARLTKAQKTNMANYENSYMKYSTQRTGMTTKQKAQYNTYLKKKKIFN